MFYMLLFTIISVTNSLYTKSLIQCRYNDPYDHSCRYDEENITLNFPLIKPQLCSTKCKSDIECPQLTCSFISSFPKCILENSFSEKYCGFRCNLTDNYPCSFDESMVCIPSINNSGVCAYLR